VIQLRHYQDQLIADVRASIKAGHRRIMLVLPTGGGKTALTATMIAGAAAKGKLSWFVNHRREILAQSVETLRDSASMELGIIAAGQKMNPFAPVQVCSIETLRRRMDKLSCIKPDILIVDECHHSPSKTWAAVMKQFPDALIIGLTATPKRLSGQGFTDLFDTMVQGPSTADLIQQGYLSDYILYRPSTVDLSKVRTQAGDYNPHQLADAMTASSVTGDAVATYLAKAAGKRGILFAWSIQSSKDFAAAFCAAGVPAEHVDGECTSKDRDAAMERFRRGETLILTNCELFGEGLDVPAIEVISMCRPTQSLGLYLQQAGRGLRMFPGKDRAILLDHAGNSFRHGLPDDPREWTLEGHDRKAASKECPVRQCGRCYAVIRLGMRVCRYCGFAAEVKELEIEVRPGELVAVSADEVLQQRLQASLDLERERKGARTRDELLAIARARGYNHRWVDHLIAARNRRAEKTMQ